MDQLLCGRRELTSIQLVSSIPGEADSGCIQSKSSGVPEMRVSPSNYDEACLFLYTKYTAVCDQRSLTHYGLNHSTFGCCSVTSQHCQIWSECTLHRVLSSRSPLVILELNVVHKVLLNNNGQKNFMGLRRLRILSTTYYSALPKVCIQFCLPC